MEKKIILTGCLIVAFGYLMLSVNAQEAKKDATPVATQEEALNLINTLIKQNSVFLVKLAHPLLPGKVRLWQQRNIIKYPSKQVPWETFIKNVHEFNTFLHILLNKNPQTKTYYHIDALIKNGALYTRLKKIANALAINEPKIEQISSPFKLDKDSLVPLQKLINIYGSTFYENKLLAVIQKFLTAFEPEAKKIRTQEEIAAQKAGREKETIPSFDLSEYDLGYGLADLDYDFTNPSYDEDYFDSFLTEPEKFSESFFD